MQAGTSWADVTPDRRLTIAGQMHVRYGEYTHDPLTVNAVAFSDGADPVVLVSCDICVLPDSFVGAVQAECERQWGLAAGRVILAATHTHLAPNTVPYLPGEVDEAYVSQLAEAVVGVVGQAIESLEPVELFADTGFIEQMGFNRRGRKTDGTVAMYHGSWNADFVGVEGPRDGAVPVIFARMSDGEVKVVIPSFASHPNSVEGESYYGADFVGSTRAMLRRNLGENVGIVYLTGAAGNTAPSQLENNPHAIHPWRGETGWARSGLYLGAEILKTIAGATAPMPNPRLVLEQAVVPIRIRPWPESFGPEHLPEGPAQEYYRQAQQMWPAMLADESPVDVHLNVIRLGEAAICTNPAELFVELGLAIKDSSPARVTAIAELTDGYCGYVPTADAFARGGYSTQPAPSSKLAEDAGDQIVARTAELLARAFTGC